MNRYIDRQTHEQIDQYIDTRTDRSAGPPAPAGAKSCAAMIYRAYTPQPHAYIDTYTCDICTDPQGLPRLLARNLVLRVGGAALDADLLHGQGVQAAPAAGLSCNVKPGTGAVWQTQADVSRLDLYFHRLAGCILRPPRSDSSAMDARGPLYSRVGHSFATSSADHRICCAACIVPTLTLASTATSLTLSCW